jgi:hypothetical protein
MLQHRDAWYTGMIWYDNPHNLAQWETRLGLGICLHRKLSISAPMNTILNATRVRVLSGLGFGSLRQRISGGQDIA